MYSALFLEKVVLDSVKYSLCCLSGVAAVVVETAVMVAMAAMVKGVFGGPTGPFQEGPGVGHKIVSDTKQMTKERK